MKQKIKMIQAHRHAIMWLDAVLYDAIQSSTTRLKVVTTSFTHKHRRIGQIVTREVHRHNLWYIITQEIWTSLPYFTENSLKVMWTTKPPLFRGSMNSGLIIACRIKSTAAKRGWLQKQHITVRIMIQYTLLRVLTSMLFLGASRVT